MTPSGAAASQIELELHLANGGRITPEEILLIETIDRVRSILAASRAMDRSYRKTWLMVDALNRMFETRVVDTFPGRKGAGAEVTPFGHRLIALYRSMQRRANKAAAEALGELQLALDPTYVAQTVKGEATGPEPVAAADPTR